MSRHGLSHWGSESAALHRITDLLRGPELSPGTRERVSFLVKALLPQAFSLQFINQLWVAVRGCEVCRTRYLSEY